MTDSETFTTPLIEHREGAEVVSANQAVVDKVDGPNLICCHSCIAWNCMFTLASKDNRAEMERSLANADMMRTDRRLQQTVGVRSLTCEA